MEEKSILTILNEVSEEMCDHYCKYPEQFADNEDELYDSICAKCPLCRLL